MNKKKEITSNKNIIKYHNPINNWIKIISIREYYLNFKNIDIKYRSR